MQAIKDYLRNLRHLPPSPRVVPELIRLLNQPDVESSKIVNMISYDPALTASVLRISNTAYFASATPTTDLQEAVTRMGFQQVYQLVVAATGARLLGSPQAGYALEQGELWKHSVTAAVAAQLVARSVGDNPNLAFTATLLHDIGKTILSNSLQAEYARVVKETDGTGQSLLEIETKLFGVNHAELGGQLLQHWKFPPNIVAAVWFHHAPKGAGAHQRLASCAYLGNMISCFMGHGYGHSALALRARAGVLATLSLAPQSIPQFMVETFEQMALIEALFTLVA
jgi:putative nucleotidyltransferase with HDIG domain